MQWHFFALYYRLNNGGIYLFQAKDDDEMNQWVAAVNGASSGEGTSGGRSQTLPASGESKEKKKGGFFTLKGKRYILNRIFQHTQFVYLYFSFMMSLSIGSFNGNCD